VELAVAEQTVEIVGTFAGIAVEGTAEGLVDSGVYAARTAAVW